MNHTRTPRNRFCSYLCAGWYRRVHTALGVDYIPDEELADAGLAEDEIAAVRGPAGLDIGAESPEEVAVSILAEIVAARAGKGSAEEDARDQADAIHAGAPEHATDPICGMTVPTDGSRPSSSYQGQTFHFCCPGCRGKFDANPAAYV